MNKSKLKAWIHASRLRTLPLALAGAILAGLLAFSDGHFRLSVFILSILTTLLLQILSNLANDYGDFSHGTDNDKRVGPQRAVQSGVIKPKEMKRAIYVTGLLAFHAGMFLLTASLEQVFSYVFILFLITGLVAIGAAIKYTVGKKPFGYKGFGDIMVFLFFGLAAVAGTYFLHGLHFNWEILLPATAIGLLSSGVLNVNNMRDIINDKNSGKLTLAVRFGENASKIYHLSLIGISLLLLILYVLMQNKPFLLFSMIIPALPLLLHSLSVIKNHEPKLLDPELKRLSLSTLFISLWIGIGLLL